MEETERRDFENPEERGKEGFALFLPHETLAKVFAIIDGDDSKTISGVEFFNRAEEQHRRRVRDFRFRFTR